MHRKKVLAFSPLKLPLILIILQRNELWSLALFSILTVLLHSKTLYVIHNVLLQQDTAFMYYWGNAKKMDFPLGTSNCQRNDCRFRRCAL